VLSFPSRGLAQANPDAYNRQMAEVAAAARSLGVSCLGSCEYCGQSLMHNAIIRDANGKHFCIGCDCAVHTGDSELITLVEAARREIVARINAARAAKKEAARMEARRDGMQVERDNNGGLTLWESEDAAREANKAQYDATLTAEEKTGWVLRNLRRATSSGSFLSSVTEELEGGKSITDFSPRAVEIIASIWAKIEAGAQKGRKVEAATEQFYATLDGLKDKDDAASELFRANAKAINAARDAAKKTGVFVWPDGLKAFANLPEAPATEDGTEGDEDGGGSPVVPSAPIAPVAPAAANLPDCLEWRNGFPYPKDGDMDTHIIIYRPHLRTDYPAQYLMPTGEFATGPERAARYSLLDLKRCVIQMKFPDGKTRLYGACASFGSVAAVRRWEAIYEEWKAAQE
jgi:hypothetical protein